MALAVARRDPHRSQARGVAFFGTWMITGLFLDGWSHNHHKPETFFTPWHAVLYSGFAAAVVWGAWDSLREERIEDTPVALTAVVGGLAADVARTWLAPSPSNVRGLRTFAVVVPAAMWLTYSLGFKAAYALPWQIHLWLGTTFFCAVTGMGLSVLVAPPEVPASA